MIDTLLNGDHVRLVKGLLATVVVAFAARFLSDHYGAPAMLMALLLGMAFHFLHTDTDCRAGIDFAASTVLRVGVALLGLRVSWQMLAELGLAAVGWVVLGTLATILIGLVGARLARQGWGFGVLTGGAVAICGVSAAMAIAAVLPKDRRSETNLTFTVMGVTVLSTIAMIAYPILVTSLGLDRSASGLFLGATIHDVAQVVGAGYTVSDETGDISTIVKLLRISLLAPVIFGLSLAIAWSGRHTDTGGKRPPLLPLFVIGFLALAALNSAVALPAAVLAVASEASRWLLLIAVVAVGMKTSLKQIASVGGGAIVLIVIETLFLAALILAVVLLAR